MKKDIIGIICIILFGALIYGLTLRGAPGNPVASDLQNGLTQPTKAFELSPERGRFVHIASLAETGSYALDRAWAEAAFPDVGYSPDGRFYSFFAPGVAYIALPFYLLGSNFGLGQVSAFSVESLVSIVTLIFLYLIGRNIFRFSPPIALFSVLTFAVASTSWSYAVTLYQNAFTACFLVSGFYALWLYRERKRYATFAAAGIWLVYALAIFVDYPNAALFLPLMVFFAIATFSFQARGEDVSFTVRWAGILTAIIFIGVTGLHFAHNAHYYGGWSKLAGTLTDLDEATFATSTPPALVRGAANRSTTAVTGKDKMIAVEGATTTVEEKTVAGFFHEENIPNGLYVLLVSDERGLLFFSPIFILALFGIVRGMTRLRTERAMYLLILLLIGTNLLIYSSWGDPWGGWAFGPRYIIPSIAFLSLFVGLGLEWVADNLLVKVGIFALFLYSTAISLLGALTTNAIPPKSEGLLLPAKEYNFLLNYDFFLNGKSSSFSFNTYFSHIFSLMDYFLLILTPIAILGMVLLFLSRPHHE